MLPRDLGGWLDLALGQWPEARIDTNDVVVIQRRVEQGVDVTQDVVDVGPGRSGVCLVESPWRVRGADDPVAPPRDHKEHRLFGLGDEAGLRPDPVARHHDVDALAGLDLQAPPPTDEILDVIGPDASRIDHDLGAHRDVDVVLKVTKLRATHPLALTQEAHELGARGDVSAVRRCRARDIHHQPGIVDLTVVVADRPVEGVGAQIGGDASHLLAEEVAMFGHTHVVFAGHGHGVVQHQASADIGALIDPLQWEQEWHRAHQVRRDPGQQQTPLFKGLAHEGEVKHLQVAQAAVDQFGAARAGAAGEVTLLDQARRQPTRYSIKSNADSGDATADHEHV